MPSVQVLRCHFLAESGKVCANPKNCLSTPHCAQSRRSSMKPTKRLLTLILSAAVLGIPSVQAFPIITNIVETGGDAEATDTIPAEYTGRTFVNGVANEPIAGKAADAPYIVGVFQEDAPMFVDRNHQWNGATTT